MRRTASSPIVLNRLLHRPLSYSSSVPFVTGDEESVTVQSQGGSSTRSDQFPVHRGYAEIEVPSETFRADNIRVEMKNGVLRMLIPKAKSVFQALGRKYEVKIT